MNDMLFDTQKMVERLENAGVAPAQARMHVAVLAEVINAALTTITERCANKEDIADVRACIGKVNTRIDRLEAHIDARFADMKSELLRWVITVGILQMALIAALVLKLVS